MPRKIKDEPSAENPAGAEATAEAPATDDIETLRGQLAAEREKSEENLNGWLRAQADFANYKRWAEQEKTAAGGLARAGFMRTLLPVLDDMERAFSQVPPELADEQWTEGLKMIARKLDNILQTEGLSPIKALGETFDPYYHEAVMQAPGKDGIVVSEIEKGYMLGERVIRHSKVVVGNGEGEAAADDTDGADRAP